VRNVFYFCVHTFFSSGNSQEDKIEFVNDHKILDVLSVFYVENEYINQIFSFQDIQPEQLEIHCIKK
jgi:hypothetical protein